MDTEKLIAAAAAAAVGAFAKNAAEGVAAAGSKVWAWIKGKASGTDAATVAAIEAAPEKPSTPDKIVGLLKDLLHDNPAATKELLALLGGEAGVHAIQTATVTGNNNAVNQIVGSGNTIGKLTR
jgi:hypothetical protein